MLIQRLPLALSPEKNSSLANCTCFLLGWVHSFPRSSVLGGFLLHHNPFPRWRFACRDLLFVALALVVMLETDLIFRRSLHLTLWCIYRTDSCLLPWMVALSSVHFTSHSSSSESSSCFRPEPNLHFVILCSATRWRAVLLPLVKLLLILFVSTLQCCHCTFQRFFKGYHLFFQVSNSSISPFALHQLHCLLNFANLSLQFEFLFL